MIPLVVNDYIKLQNPNIYDATAIAGDWQHLLGQEERLLEVDGRQFVEDFLGRFDDTSGRTDAGIVDKAVEIASPRPGSA